MNDNLLTSEDKALHAILVVAFRIDEVPSNLENCFFCSEEIALLDNAIDDNLVESITGIQLVDQLEEHQVEDLAADALLVAALRDESLPPSLLDFILTQNDLNSIDDAIGDDIVSAITGTSKTDGSLDLGQNLIDSNAKEDFAKDNEVAEKLWPNTMFGWKRFVSTCLKGFYPTYILIWLVSIWLVTGGLYVVVAIAIICVFWQFLELSRIGTKLYIAAELKRKQLELQNKLLLHAKLTKEFQSSTLLSLMKKLEKIMTIENLRDTLNKERKK